MTDHTIVALVTRRAELAGEMHTLQTRLHQIHADLAALDDVIRQFDPDYRLETIRPYGASSPSWMPEAERMPVSLTSSSILPSW